MIAARHAYDATISDCFVYVENVESMKNYCGGVGKNYDSVNISNVVVVGVTGIADTSGTKNGEYASVEAFKTANPNFTLDGWDTSFWTVENGLPIPKTLATDV